MIMFRLIHDLKAIDAESPIVFWGGGVDKRYVQKMLDYWIFRAKSECYCCLLYTL